MWAGIGAGALAGAGQWIANAQARGMSREQMRFQERMSSTAWQRGVKDMQAAGINPMLAVSQGGATSPPGAKSEFGNVAGAGVSSAVAARQTTLQAKQIQSQIKLQDATADQMRVLAEVAEQGLRYGTEAPEGMVGAFADAKGQKFVPLVAAKMLSEIQLTRSSARRTEAETQVANVLELLRRAEIPQAEAIAKFWSDEFVESMGPVFRPIVQIIRLLIAAGR